MAAVKEKPNYNPFATLDANGNPVKRRFGTAKALREVFTTLQQQDLTEAARRSKIFKVYSGSKPFDPTTRKNAGMRDLANINFMELKGVIDARTGPIHDMALDTTPLIELRPLSAEQAGPQAQLDGDIIASEFSVTLRESRKFLPAVTTMVREADLYGLGPVMWPDYLDFQPIALERAQLKFPEDASAISSENELYMVESVLPAWYLFSLFDDPEGSKEEGWDLAAVKRYIVNVFGKNQNTESQGGDKTGTSVEEATIALMRQNRFFEIHQFDTLRVIHAFVREVEEPRGVTHYISATSDDPEGFLFVKDNAYESMDQCILWLPYTVSERYARAVRGLASYVLPIADINARLACRIYDAADRASSFLMTSAVPGGSQQLTITEHGPYIVAGAGLTPQQAQMAPNFQQLAAVREMGSNMIANNAAGARGPTAQPERIYSGADRKTKQQVAMENMAGAKVEASLFVLRSTVFDALFRECFRRFMFLINHPEYHDRYPDVKKFISRCKRRGIGIKALRRADETYAVYMCRDLVTGGAGAKADMLESMLQTVGGNLDEPGRLAATRDIVECRFGVRAADRYRPTIGRDTTASDAASHAVLENNDMTEGSQTLAAPDQLHWSHIPVHWQLIHRIVDQVSQGQIDEPQRMLDILQLASEHVRMHIQYGGMQTGMEGAAKEAEASLRSLAPIVRALTLAAQAQAKQQEAEAKRQQQEMEELQARADGQDAQVEMHKSDIKGQLAMREQDLLHQARMAGVQSKSQTDMIKAQNKAEIDRIMANARRFIEASKITGGRSPQTGGLVPDSGLAERPIL
jgi:hypothetical protein